LLAAFQIEYREPLESLRRFLSRQETGAPLVPDELDEAFRRVHSLKGAARATDLRPVETLAHRLETLFAKARTGVIPLDFLAIKGIEQAADAIEDWVVAYSAGSKPADPVAAIKAVESILAGETVPPNIGAIAPNPIRGDAPAPLITNQKEVRGIAPGERGRQPTIPSTLPPSSEDSVRVSTSSLDALLRSADRLLTETARQARVGREMHAIELRLGAIGQQWRRLMAGDPQADFLMRDLPSLAKAVQAVRRDQDRGSFALHQLALAFQTDVRQARMVTADSVFGDFRKMVRALARDHGMEIEVQLDGLYVLADRLVLHALKDPVMHMLRNSLYHGIETRAERVAKNKNPVGRIRLHCAVEGSRLALTVEDDGRGLDLHKIAETAMQAGLMPKEQMASASENDLTGLIFTPGFSTAETIGDLAGRGMGMSVVHQTVAKLNGEMQIGGKAGAGARFHILVPLWAAIRHLLMVSCQGQMFGIPTDGIERATRVAMDTITTVEGKATVRLLGQPMPLVSLAHVLGMTEEGLSGQGGFLAVVVLRAGTSRIALSVDACLTIRESLIRDLNLPLATSSAVTGGILLDDGTVAIVLSPFKLISAAASGGGRTLTITAPAPKKPPPLILVVDDSVTTRTLEKSILEANGYRVQLAVDGAEALALLRTQVVDLVVTDVQMPRLDGFGLLREMKQDKMLADIPVIVVSSVETPEEQERGLALGADAYVVKRKFDQQVLLETIEQIL
ncbi:MAG: response regulator, partial [Alphaproteobacteria bacterium]|nr:response regulator [Alphaproteobacteria bacterium]